MAARRKKPGTALVRRKTALVKHEDDAPTREMRAAIVEKLHPQRFRTSPKLHALIGFALDRDWIRTADGGLITHISTTSDGFLIAHPMSDDGESQHDILIGDVEDLWRNFTGAAEAAGLTREEQQLFLQIAMEKFGARLGSLDRRAHLWEF